MVLQRSHLRVVRMQNAGTTQKRAPAARVHCWACCCCAAVGGALCLLPLALLPQKRCETQRT
ncbi:MAG: hypothetical protein MI867_17660, partial [Pseudomonadales bacterium]|nr:hypothetical protein [Pseudomonadales bacterium]